MSAIAYDGDKDRVLVHEVHTEPSLADGGPVKGGPSPASSTDRVDPSTPERRDSTANVAAAATSWRSRYRAQETPPTMAVAESNQRSEAFAVEASSGAGRGRPGYPQSRDHAGHDPAAEALAVGAVLFRAHDAARHLENLLELEAADRRVAELMRDAKRVRKAIAALLVEVTLDLTPEVPA